MHKQQKNSVLTNINTQTAFCQLHQTVINN